MQSYIIDFNYQNFLLLFSNFFLFSLFQSILTRILFSLCIYVQNIIICYCLYSFVISFSRIRAIVVRCGCFLFGKSGCYLVQICSTIHFLCSRGQHIGAFINRGIAGQIGAFGGISYRGIIAGHTQKKNPFSQRGISSFLITNQICD